MKRRFAPNCSAVDSLSSLLLELSVVEHSHPISALSVFGEFVFSGDDGGCLKVWCVKTNMDKACWTCLHSEQQAHSGMLLCLEALQSTVMEVTNTDMDTSAQAVRVASGGTDGMIKVWRVSMNLGVEMEVCMKHPSIINAVAVGCMSSLARNARVITSASHCHLFSACGDSNIYVWKYAIGKGGSVGSDWSVDGNTSDKTLLPNPCSATHSCWTYHQKLAGHVGSVTTLTLSESLNVAQLRLFSGSADGTIRVWALTKEPGTGSPSHGGTASNIGSSVPNNYWEIHRPPKTTPTALVP